MAVQFYLSSPEPPKSNLVKLQRRLAAKAHQGYSITLKVR